jgi:hypothetical protein
MSTNKLISGDYNITSVNSGDNVVVTTNTLKVVGNLDVVGNVTYIESTNTTIVDPFITVAGNNTGNVSTALFKQQGLVAQISSSQYAGLRFDNPSGTWQISPDVAGNGAPITAYQPIATSANTLLPGGGQYSIQYNAGGTALGGSDSFLYTPTNNGITITAPFAYGNLGATPTPVANSVVVYANTQSIGGTGLYVKSNFADDELISKTRAFAYALFL